MNLLELSEQEIVRRGSLDEMRKMGIDPGIQPLFILWTLIRPRLRSLSMMMPNAAKYVSQVVL